MSIAESTLFQLARSLYRTEVAHSTEMKDALRHEDAYDAYRATESDRILAAIRKYRIPIHGRKIVDFGRSDGAISAEYVRAGAKQVIGVDIDERALQRARALHALRFVQSSTTAIPLEDGSVDAVISFDVFEHVSNPAAILEEFHRILTAGGQAMIGTWS